MMFTANELQVLYLLLSLILLCTSVACPGLNCPSRYNAIGWLERESTFLYQTSITTIFYLLLDHHSFLHYFAYHFITLTIGKTLRFLIGNAPALITPELSRQLSVVNQGFLFPNQTNRYIMSRAFALIHSWSLSKIVATIDVQFNARQIHFMVSEENEYEQSVYEMFTLIWHFHNS